ncbi:MAG: hypothetical protein M0R06_03380 [Sphaerochaeta sp.]|jgi:hypothetical protein|nr:hypothetical protein [Sphaerochaeta sp.]
MDGTELTGTQPTQTPTGEPTQPTPQSPAQPAQSESYVNPDGTLKDGWFNQVVPEEHRKNTAWLGIKSIGDMTNQITHLQTKLTSQGKGVFPIDEKSTPEQVRDFRQAMNVPEKPEGYSFTVPAELERYYQDDEMLAEAKQTLHGVHLSQKQFTAVMALDALRMKKAEEAMRNDPVPFYKEALGLATPKLKEEAEQELRQKWGDAYNSRLQLANAAIEENTKDGEEREQLLERIGNDPLVADFIATIQNKHFTESNGVDTSLGQGAKSMNIDQQIDSLMRNPHYLDGNTNPMEHDRIVKEVQRLYSQKTGGKLLQ